MQTLRVPKNITLVHIDYEQTQALDVVLEENAQLHHIRMASNGSSQTSVTVGRDARYRLDFLMADRASAQQSVNVQLQAANANAEIYGVQLGGDDSRMGTNVLVSHLAPHCTSRQFVRNVLDGTSKLGFEGKVFVDQTAQKTDGYQLCNSILLSEKAEIKTKPELEIYADDVKCSHGNTVGRLDKNTLFYIRQRGLPAAMAKKMLLGSFVAEVFDNEQAATHLMLACQQWLDKHVV